MKLKRIILNAAAALALVLTPSLTPAIAHAAPSSCPNVDTAKGKVFEGIGQTGNDCDDSKVNETFRTIVTLLSVIVGIASVIVIIYSGLKYITSAGDSAKVENAKTTLLYAVVGLAVAGLAQIMIRFILYQTNK